MRFPTILVLLGSAYIHSARAEALRVDPEPLVVQGRSFTIEWLSDSQDVSGGYQTFVQDHANFFLQFLELRFIHRSPRRGRTGAYTLLRDRVNKTSGDSYLLNVTDSSNRW